MLPVHTQKHAVEAIIAAAVATVTADFATAAATDGAEPVAYPAVEVERPKVAAHGDLATNIALQLAKLLKTAPRALAERLVVAILARQDAAALIAAAEVAGPGFINLRLTDAARQAVLAAVFAQRDSFGRTTAVSGQRVLVEYVSANPTGPLHVGHGRQAALGDALSNVLATQGWQVWREFYYNDAGVQIRNLALSVQARARGLVPDTEGWPEAAYNGEYIADIARAYVAGETVAANDGEPVRGAGAIDDIEAIRRFAVAYLRREQDADLQAFGIAFDRYFLESSLYTDGRVAAAVAALSAAGKTYEQEGALWLRTTEYGDDKDRVMRKSDGTFTYFVPDIAYHQAKWERGFTKVINVQGSDHHGTIARVRAGLQALGQGIPAGYPDYILHKMVRVVRNGKEVKISKRAGSYVTLRDLIEWSGGAVPDDATDSAEASATADAVSAGATTATDVDAPANGAAHVPATRDLSAAAITTRGRDAVRFFLVSRKADTEFTFDIDLALKQNDENPVYYVQYAHARICSVLAQWGGDPALLPDVDVAPLTSEREVALLAQLADYPGMLSHAAAELAPHAVAFYLRDLAAAFHSFYNAERVLIDDEAVKHARLALLWATAQVLRNGLATIGVSAPSKM